MGIELGSSAHRRAWEAGHIDYFGRDSFSNIEQQLKRNIEQNSYQSHPTEQREISSDKTPTSILKTLSNGTINSFQDANDLPVKTGILKSSINGTTTTTTHSNNVPPLPTSTTTLQQNVTKLPTTTTTTIKTTVNIGQNRSEQSNLPPLHSSHQRTTYVQSHSVLQDSKLTSNPLKTSEELSKRTT